MNQRVTIGDVAKAAGISGTTVSRIINGHYEKMRPATRQRVEAVIKELHFIPTASAQRLRQRQGHVIGVLVGDIANPFSFLLAKGIDDILKQAGYDILLMNTNNSLRPKSGLYNAFTSSKLTESSFNQTQGTLANLVDY